MFTGIVQGAQPIVAIRDHPAGRRITVDLALPAGREPNVSLPSGGGLGRGEGVALDADPLVLGESIALDGVCLTVAAADGGRATFDVIAETLRLTTLGRRHVGERVDIERALRPTDRLGGHFVQGHVDGTAVLAQRRESPQEVVLEFSAGRELLDEMIPKGSVAIDGVSLTLVEVDRPAGRFAVALIPTTLAMTTLGVRQAGEPVNIETDLIGKWIRRYLADMLGGSVAPGGLTMEKLREAGFV